jgi:hypothetical protein
VEEGTGVIPGKASFELSDDAVIAVGCGPIRRLEPLLDIVEGSYVSLMVSVVMPVGRLGTYDAVASSSE